MDSFVSKEAKRTALQRLRVLQALQGQFPSPVTNRTLANAFRESDSDLDLTDATVARCMAYLGDHKLVVVESQGGITAARCHANGLDFLEGNGSLDYPGIAKP